MNIKYEIQYNTGVFKDKDYIKTVDLDYRNWSNDNMSNAFVNCSRLETVNKFSDNIVNMSNAFVNCYNLTNIDNIPNNVRDMDRTFYRCSKINRLITIPNSVKSMNETFYGCSNFNQEINIPLNVENLNRTFYGCEKITSVNILSNKITSMNETFAGCYMLNMKINIPANVRSMIGTFANCTSLSEIPTIPDSVKNISNCFYSCSNIESITDITVNIENISGAFDRCVRLNGDINIYSSNITNAMNCFANTTLNKDVYLPLVFDNGANTPTYESFKLAGYSTDVRKDGVLIKDINGDISLRKWRYDVIENEHNLLYEYLGDDIDLVVPTNRTILNNVDIHLMPYVYDTPFYDKSQFNSIDLSNVPFANNDMSNAFYNCQNLKSVTNINENVTNMSSTFWNCYNLVNVPTIPNSVTDMSYTFMECYNLVNAPVIPNSVTNMSYTFIGCSNLVNAPVIPNSVINMRRTFDSCYNLINAPVIPNNVTDMGLAFYECRNLVNAPVIPNSVTNMSETFSHCYNLVNVPVIPDSVTNMSKTFDYCRNLSGNIYIHSENVSNAINCFNNTELNKIVYIPFTFENGVNTSTYNSFINAGYTDQIRKNGVLLKDINEPEEFNDWRYNTSNDIKTLYEYLGSNTTIVVPNASTLINNYTSGSTTINSNTPFYNNQNVVIADLMYVPFVNNDMSNAFYNDNNLTNVINIYNGITNLSNTFSNCINLVNVSNIPNSVVDMSYAFDNCRVFNQEITIPNSVTNMSGTFNSCYSLEYAPNIPDSVVDMSNLFNNCQLLSGNIYIESENVIDAEDCFNGTYLNKNVYMHFTYENGVNTSTYNTFKQYYGDGQNGVTLIDIDGEDIDISDYINTVDENRNVRLVEYIGDASIKSIVTPHLNEE